MTDIFSIKMTVMHERSLLILELMEKKLELQKKHHDVRMERDKELYERQIKIVNALIDRRVYDLYGLAEEEVGI